MSREEIAHEVDMLPRGKGHSGHRVYGDVEAFWNSGAGSCTE